MNPPPSTPSPRPGTRATRRALTPCQNVRLDLQTLVYIVDDDETARSMAEMILADGEFRVCSFADGQSALAALESEAPDVVVVDVLMPGMDGFEFCSRLRSQPRWSDIPVLMATALDDAKAIDRAYDVGATCFMVKPINWDVEKYRLRYMIRAADSARRLRLKEQEMRHAKEEWERTFNSIKDAVTVLDLNLNVIHCNSAAAHAMGKPTNQISGAPCYRLFKGAEAPCPRCLAIQAISTGLPQSAEIASIKHPGRIWQVDLFPIHDRQGRMVSIVRVAREITEQRNLESQCRQAQKMEAIGTLSGGVAHEFNNLLQIIMGHAGSLARAAGAKEEVTAAHRVIVDAAMRGSALTRQLLDFSRKGQIQSTRWPLDLNPVIQESLQMLSHLLPKNVTISTSIATNLRQTSADSGQIQQVLVNLALNAAQAMPGGGTLTIQTTNASLDAEFCHFHPEFKPGEYVELRVTDTGHGMDQKTMDRIYEPFFTTKKPGQGTGLGLTVVFGIVRQHGGGIVCASRPGKGTTFSVFLPRYVPSSETPPHPTHATRKVSQRNELIMVVDDEQPIRRTVAAELEASGYAVLTVPDGEIAVDIFRDSRNRPDLVVLDLGMPGIGGWECLKRLRLIDPSVKVILATGYGSDETHQQARQEGAAGLVCKPFEISALEAQIRQAIEQ